MRKIAFWVFGLFTLLVATAATGLYNYPYLPKIVDEGFPSPQWPSKGIFLQVDGVPVKLTEQIQATKVLRSPAGVKLETLLKESETDVLLGYHKGVLKYVYFRSGVDGTVRFNSYSMAKSLIGYLVLKAIDEGEIDSVDSPIGNYLLDLKDKKLAALPIKNFLEMKSGLAFEAKKKPKPLARDAKRPPDKDNSNPFSLLARLHIEGLSGVSQWLKLPEKPNFDYHYQNVNTALLGAMLVKIYNIPLSDLLSEKLWKPAGASHAQWRTYTNDGGVTPYCCLFAKAEDWAKVGIYISQNGRPGAPFLSERLMKLISAKRFAPDLLRDGVYGFHVRHDILDREGEALQGPFTYFIGHGGQLVYIKPKEQFVVVRFGRRHTLLHSTLYFLWREIMAGEKAQ